MKNEKLYLAAVSFQVKSYENKLTLAESIRKTKDIGYDGITFGSTYCRIENRQYSIKEIKDLLDETGLELLNGSTTGNYAESDRFGVNHYMDLVRYYHIHHLDFNNMGPFADTDYAIDFFGQLGAKYISLNNCSFITPEREDCIHLAEYLNDIGRRAHERYNMKAAWHNHLFEFWPIDEDMVIEILIKNTNPEWVTFELDAGWCVGARLKPDELVRKYPGRFEMIQFRETDTYFGPQQPGWPEGPNYYITRLNENNQIERVPRMQQEADIILTNCPAGKGLYDWKILKQTVSEQAGDTYFMVERTLDYKYPRDKWACLEEDFQYYRKIMDRY